MSNTKHTPKMKTAQELYSDTVSYANLRNAFSVMMKQYKQLEERIADLEIEASRMKNAYDVRGREIRRLNEELTKATGGAE